MKASFIQRGEAVDFIPSRNVDAGEIIRFGSLLGVVKIPVRAGELGALHLSGIYDVEKDNGSIAAGSKVYWNESSELATTNDSGNIFCEVDGSDILIGVHPNFPALRVANLFAIKCEV